MPKELADLSPADRKRYAEDLQFLVDSLQGVPLAEAIEKQRKRFRLT